MNEVKKNGKTISKAAEFSDIISFYPNLVAILHIWTDLNHLYKYILVTIIEIFPMKVIIKKFFLTF